MSPYHLRSYKGSLGTDKKFIEVVRDEMALLNLCDVDLDKIQKYKWPEGSGEVKTVAFFLPPFDSVYAGIYNILHFAESFQARNIQVSFYILDASASVLMGIKKLIAFYKPSLSIAPVHTIFSGAPKLSSSADLGIATLWTTAYLLLVLNIKKKAYFIQDNEASFYQAGTINALAEQTYRFGFFCIANTSGLLDMYRREYLGDGVLVPSYIDLSSYLKKRMLRNDTLDKKKYRVLFYGRPNNPRNGFSLVISSSRLLKKKYGEKIDIYSAGSEWNEEDYDVQGIITNFGKLPISQLPALYASMDIGIMFMYSGHPGVVASEFMAAGIPVIVNRNSDMTWDELYKDRETCLLTSSTPTSVVSSIEELINNHELRGFLVKNAKKNIESYYRNYNKYRDVAINRLLK